MTAFASEVKHYSQTAGLSRALIAAGFTRLLRRVLPRGVTLPLPVPGCSSWIRARSKTSDASVYAEVFFSDNYALDSRLDPSLVVDAGANAGYTAVLFSRTWPAARIIALEPDESNYRQLVRNTRGYPNVEAHLAALWGEPASLRILNPEGNKSGIRVEPSEGEDELPTAGGHPTAMTVSNILRLTGATTIDVFKVDIEGSELNLFSRDPGCLDHVGLLMIELHERFAPGSTEALYRALEGRRFEVAGHGNMTYVALSRESS